MKKYEITDIAHPDNPNLHRIRALTDLTEDVLAGMLGGYVESYDDLDQEGRAWISEDAIACENAVVCGDAVLTDHAVAKGYEVTCNIMAISNAQEADIRVALDLLGKSPVNVIYIVDSFGALFPEQIARIAALYGEYAAKYGKKLGIHAHNNQQLAFANTVEAVGDGVDWLDGTYSEMGRGAGNCAMELLLGFLKNPKYNLYPAVQFIEKHMTKLKEDGVVWGYDMQYLLTGMLNQHPRTAIQFTKDKRKDFSTFYKEITSQE